MNIAVHCQMQYEDMDIDGEGDSLRLVMLVNDAVAYS